MRGYPSLVAGQGTAEVTMRALLLPLLLSAGCSDMSLNAKGDGAPMDSGSYAGDDTEYDSGTPTEDYAPDGWVLRADLAIAGGVPVADGAVVAIDVVDSVAGAVACTIDVAPADAAEATVPEEADVWAWWTLAVPPAEDACVDVLPTTVNVGIGALASDVRARLGVDGYDAVADSLYGAYLSADDGPVYVFGYAGTDGDLAGDDPAADPPADGLYHLAPLYVLGLPG